MGKDMEYIIGNIPKIGLGSISLVYCLIIIGQMCYYGRSKQTYVKIGIDETVAQDTVIKVYAQTVGVRNILDIFLGQITLFRINTLARYRIKNNCINCRNCKKKIIPV